MVNIKIIIILFFLNFEFLISQFTNINLNIDTRQLREGQKYIFDTFKEDISDYYLINKFHDNGDNLEINLDIHLVIQNVNTSGNNQVISTQIILSNQLDQQYITKSADFNYSKGMSINFNQAFQPLSSLLDYYAFLFIASELDTYDYMGGDSYFIKAENIASDGKNSDYPKGWSERWKKVRKIKDNHYLRTIRYNFFISLDELNSDEPNFESISLKMDLCYENLLSIENIYGSDRNLKNFLKIYAEDISYLFFISEMKYAIKHLVDFDDENKEIYLEYLR